MARIEVSLTVTDPPQVVLDYMSKLFGETMRAGYEVTMSAVPVEDEWTGEPQHPESTRDVPEPPPVPPGGPRRFADDEDTVELPEVQG